MNFMPEEKAIERCISEINNNITEKATADAR
jgi:hypothetical protein